MKLTGEQPVVLVAEDDDDDRLLVGRALTAVRNDLRVAFVTDGEELLAYLRGQSVYADPAVSPRPHLVLLDLNMPRMGGREALAELRRDPALAAIPVVVLTTSHADSDVLAAYRLGANSYLAKPAEFDLLVETMRLLTAYWFGGVELPRGGSRERA